MKHKEQTAVEFAVAKLEKFIPKGNQIAIDAILNQAKEMEKQQIMDDFNNGVNDECLGKNTTAEQYYKEEYGKNNQPI